MILPYYLEMRYLKLESLTGTYAGMVTNSHLDLFLLR